MDAGYVTCVIDERDRRIHRLYTTAAAGEIMEYLRGRIVEWEQSVCFINAAPAFTADPPVYYPGNEKAKCAGPS